MTHIVFSGVSLSHLKNEKSSAANCGEKKPLVGLVVASGSLLVKSIIIIIYYPRARERDQACEYARDTECVRERANELHSFNDGSVNVT